MVDSDYVFRVTVRRFVSHYGLPPHLAKRMAKLDGLDQFIEDIEEFRHREGACLPPSCPLVSGFIRDRLTS